MNPTTKTVSKIALYILICATVISTTFALGYTSRAAHAPVSGEAASLSLFWETWNLIDQHFYGSPPDETARTYGAIRGSLATLNDPYTVFVEPVQHEREQEELRGSFGGIGAWVERTPEGRILLTPMDDRPAAEAGILAGDELIAVNGTPVTAEMSVGEVVDMVKGEVGQIVTLTIRREGVEEPLDIEVERAEIVVPSVAWQPLDQDPTIGYIRISIFNERTAQELREAIQALHDQDVDKLIVDLRNNGGGLLSAAIDVTSEFVSDGVVLYDRRSSGEEKAYPVNGKGLAYSDSLVILVNSATASASEITAGAIQDTERGILVGTQTFGKASVQLLFDLSDGSSLHVTNAHWLTPNRREITGVGLTPDRIVELTDQDRQEGLDPQLAEAIAYLQGE